jgi:hypothetical protein
MPAQLFLIDYLGMTALASVMTGMGNWAARHFGDRISTIVSVLAEGFGNDSGAQDHEGDERDQHDGGEPKKVFDVLEQSLTFGVRNARLNRERCESAMVFDTGNWGGER